MEWASAGDLGDYTFCPRSHQYARTLGETGPEDPKAVAGRRFHDRALRSVEARDAHRTGYAVAAAVAALAIAGLLYLLWFRGG